MRPKISVIGAGNVGAELALALAIKNIGDVVLLDIVEGMPQGKSLDMTHAFPFTGTSISIKGTQDYDDVKGSDAVVITAGVPRKPGMTREDLLRTNFNIVKSVCEKIKEVAPNSIVIVVTNPLDAMVYTAYKVLNFPRYRVMGMAGALDSARFRAFIALELGVSPVDVQAMVLGTHGDLMVPLPRFTSVAGIPAEILIPKEKMEQIINRTRNAGTEIVQLLKTGSAYYAPGIATAEMVESIVRDQNRIFTVSMKLEGEYGIKDIFVGVPVILGSGGIKKVLELSLRDDELQLLKKSAEHVKKLQDEVDQLFSS